MNRQQLEHIIRAAAATADVREIVVIGSQAVLATYPDAPARLLRSMEADVYPKQSPERSIVIDGAIGESSLFHVTFGYYAHGVGVETAVLPDGWEQRLVRLETAGTMGVVGWCLEVHDLAVSKLAACREKDMDFVEELVRKRLASADVIRERIMITPRMTAEHRIVAEARLQEWQ